MAKFMQFFVRLTGWLPQKLCFRTKILYEDRSIQSRYIHGPAILVSNHTALFDYAAMLFVFWTRTLRYQMAEILFKKPVLGPFLKLMGGVHLDRYAHQYGFMEQSLAILGRGGVLGVFPEGRLPRPGETPPIDFQPGAAYLSLASGVPIIPVWTDGQYFSLRRAHVMIGTPLDPGEFSKLPLPEKEKIALYTKALRDKVIDLKELAHEQIQKK